MNNYTKDERHKRRQRCYNTPQWKALRKDILMEHPLCIDCEKEGRITPATECHHTNKPFRETDDDRMWEKFLDRSAIVPLCKECHIKRHNPDSLSMKEKLDKYK